MFGKGAEGDICHGGQHDRDDLFIAPTILVNVRILDATRSGDAAVNDCTLQPLVRELPFGGVGNSGMGKYHGEWGFRAYTNARGVLYHSTMLDPGVRYPPYSEHERLRGLLARMT